jgi:hypothetical protein
MLSYCVDSLRNVPSKYETYFPLRSYIRRYLRTCYYFRKYHIMNTFVISYESMNTFESIYIYTKVIDNSMHIIHTFIRNTSLVFIK